MGRARTGVIALLAGVALLGGCTGPTETPSGDRTDHTDHTGEPASLRSVHPRGYPLPVGERIEVGRLPGDQTRVSVRAGDVLVVTRSEFPTDSNAVLVLAAATDHRLSYQAIAPGTVDLVIDTLPPAASCTHDSPPCAGQAAPPMIEVVVVPG